MSKIVPAEDVVKILSSNPKYDYSYFLSQPSPSLDKLIITRTLTGKGRKIVIDLIKWPIEKALIRSVKLFIRIFGRVTKETTIKHNTHVLLDLTAEFFGHYTLKSRMELMDCAWELLSFENEHDSHYEWLFNWLVKRIAEERVKGNWIDLPASFPQQGCWKE